MPIRPRRSASSQLQMWRLLPPFRDNKCILHLQAIQSTGEGRSVRQRIATPFIQDPDLRVCRCFSKAALVCQEEVEEARTVHFEVRSKAISGAQREIDVRLQGPQSLRLEHQPSGLWRSQSAGYILKSAASLTPTNPALSFGMWIALGHAQCYHMRDAVGCRGISWDIMSTCLILRSIMGYFLKTFGMSSDTTLPSFCLSASYVA